jgi:hypothetical protein
MLPATPPTIPKIAEATAKSLFLEMYFNDMKLAVGTGFIVFTARGPALITNRHNVTGRDQNTGQPLDQKYGGVPNRLVIHHHSMFGLGTWVSKSESLYDEDKPLWMEHPSLGAKADFVALPLTQTSDVRFFAYDPANVGQPILVGIADPVSVVGFPFGIRSGGNLPVWATGFVASEPQIDHDQLPMFLIDCRTRRGQSGSAVIAYRNTGSMIPDESGGFGAFGGPVYRFLGIYSGRVNAESDLGMVWKASAIAELVASIQ